MARPDGLRIAAVSIAAALGLAVSAGVTVDAMSDEAPDVYVTFADASPLIKGNDVKAAGVKVGTIGSIEVDGGVAKVGLVLDDEVLPLHQDATARVRPVGLLGERFIELDRGSADAPILADGASLPLEQTSRATDLDEVLDMVDAPTGEALSMLVTTLGQGILGKGENADRAIKALAPALQDTNRLAAILNDQNAVLQDLVDSVTPVVEQLADGNGKQLDALLDATNRTLSATARNDAELGRTLDRLPGALKEARATLAALTGVAGSTAPVLAALRPATDNLAKVSSELEDFSDSAAPALDSLDPVLDEADVLLDRARPVARSLSSLSGDMRSTARSGRVLGTKTLDNITTILDFVRNWALTTNGQDGLSHYFRAHVVVTSEVLTGLVPKSTGGRPSAGSNGTGRSAIPEAVPPLDGLLNGLLGPVGGVLSGSKTSKAASGGSATGLSATQEQGLLSYLIGGR